jgi:hypothetical protein
VEIKQQENNKWIVTVQSNRKIIHRFGEHKKV